MRSSFAIAPLAVVAVAALAVSACSVSTTGNSITFKTQPEFVDPNVPAKTASKAWDGEEIEINNSGVNPLTGTGGITVVFDPAATTISAKADIVARADAEPEAKLSMQDALATFQISEGAGKTTISCGNGGQHGSSSRAASGCKRLTVTIPAGSEAKPHRLRVGLGNGDIKFSGAPFVSSLIVDNNGLGEVDVSANPTMGSTITVTGEDVVIVRVPATFSADEVILTINVDSNSTTEQNRARIITTDFPGMESNKPYGTPGAGARSLNVQTKGPFTSDTLTIARL